MLHFLKIVSCDIIYGTDAFLVIKLFFCCKIIAWFTIIIWWVVIFFINFSKFFYLNVYFLFLISCNIVLSLTAVKLFYLVILLTNRPVVVVGLFHDWDSWDPFINSYPSGVYGCFSFVSRSFTLVLPARLLVTLYICINWDISQYLSTWRTVYPIHLMGTVKFTLLFSVWWDFWWLWRIVHILGWFPLDWGHWRSHFWMVTCSE